MIEKITWKATVEEDSELSLDDIKVLADAINILVDEHNKLLDIINNLSTSNNTNMIGNLLGAFTGLNSPPVEKDIEDSSHLEEKEE